MYFRFPPATQIFNADVRLCEISPSSVPGEFRAAVNGEMLITSSRQPFVDSARVLAARGCDTNSVLILRHAGSTTNAIVGKIGTVAKLTVREGASSPRFAAWKPYPSRAVAPSVRQSRPGVAIAAMGATT